MQLYMITFPKNGFRFRKHAHNGRIFYDIIAVILPIYFYRKYPSSARVRNTIAIKPTINGGATVLVGC